MRVGVVADSHVGEFLETLPPGVLDALDGCDLIIHAGDICDLGVLDELRAVAPVQAVRGDHDRGAARQLPRDLVVDIGGARIGVTHGRRPRPLEYAVVLAHLAARRPIDYTAGLHRALIARFGAIDCLVYGHWHEPCEKQVGSVLCFSPGAVCPWGSLEGGRKPRPGFTGVTDRAVGRYRRQFGSDVMRPRVGVLEISDGRIRPHLIPLD